MILVKILGVIDLVSAVVFLTLALGAHPYFQIILFCAGLLLLKGLFILKGNLLSIVDLICCFILLLSLLVTPSALFLWLPALVLTAKGIVSFF